MNEITTIGLDLAKHVFQVHGIDAEGKTVLRKQLRRFPGSTIRLEHNDVRDVCKTTFPNVLPDGRYRPCRRLPTIARHLKDRDGPFGPRWCRPGFSFVPHNSSKKN